MSERHPALCCVMLISCVRILRRCQWYGDGDAIPLVLVRSTRPSVESREQAGLIAVMLETMGCEVRLWWARKDWLLCSRDLWSRCMLMGRLKP